MNIKYVKGFTVFLSIAIFCASFNLLSGEVKGKTFSFKVKDDVSFTCNDDDNSEIYTFSWKNEKRLSSTLMLLPYPAISAEKEIKDATDSTVKKFRDESKDVLIGYDVAIEVKPANYNIFNGTEIKFVMSKNSEPLYYQYIFLLWDGKRAWLGQFTTYSLKDIIIIYDVLVSASFFSENKTREDEVTPAIDFKGKVEK